MKDKPPKKAACLCMWLAQWLKCVAAGAGEAAFELWFRCVSVYCTFCYGDVHQREVEVRSERTSVLALVARWVRFVFVFTGRPGFQSWLR